MKIIVVSPPMDHIYYPGGRKEKARNR